MKKDRESTPVAQPPDNSVPVVGELRRRTSAPGDGEELHRRRMTHVTVSALRVETTTIDETRSRIKPRNA